VAGARRARRVLAGVTRVVILRQQQPALNIMGCRLLLLLLLLLTLVQFNQLLLAFYKSLSDSKVLLETGFLLVTFFVNRFVVFHKLKMCLSVNFQTLLEGLTTLHLKMVANSRVEELYLRFIKLHTDIAELCFQEVQALGR
jgi:hypothetical protein